MKKFTFIAVLCCFAALFSGCEDIKESNKEPAESSAAETVENTDDIESSEELSSRDREINTETDFVFDDAGILNDSEWDQLNTYTAWISKTFKINAAVVTSDDIGDKKPEEYAEEYYNELYSGDGFLFLLNNDTGNDYFYRKGVPSMFITGGDIEMLFAEISPWLVTGEYFDSIEHVLETAELKLPEYLTDRSHILEKEDIKNINDKIKDAAGENSLNLFLTSDTGEKSIEDYAKENFNNYYDKNSDSAMLAVNTSDGSSYICASGSLEHIRDKQEDIQKDIKDCLKTDENGEEYFDCSQAADCFISLIE
ncbi:TPM domain-containing protein [Porcipelethomonas sp.]|uniref:TPM domain-containing protein n=1 Tax=Porcipelethomonas sp. TaxID=2981675 RepID=UPI003EF880FF